MQPSAPDTVPHPPARPDTGCSHPHAFGGGDPLAERNTRRAAGLTAAAMLAEIAGGWAYGSMALLADGWHMGSHALALGLSAAAYVAARRLAGSGRFAFGTWKIEILGGYTSAILLALVAATMLWQSAARLVSPAAIRYDEAIALGLLGLAVNLACAWLLRGGHGHGHGHDHGHGHGHGHDHGHDRHGDAHPDLNLRSAYLHVVADAATSVLALAALLGGKLRGWDWLDPAVGIAGAVLVGAWAVGLLRDCARVLLDAEMDAPVAQEIRDAVAQAPFDAALRDLHVWRVGAGKYACIVAVATADDVAPDDIRRLLAVHEELAHVTVEVNRTAPAGPAAHLPPAPPRTA